jgi:hypothetical protein
MLDELDRRRRRSCVQLIDIIEFFAQSALFARALSILGPPPEGSSRPEARPVGRPSERRKAGRERRGVEGNPLSFRSPRLILRAVRAPRPRSQSAAREAKGTPRHGGCLRAWGMTGEALIRARSDTPAAWRRAVVGALRAAGGNVAVAAATLGVATRTVRRWRDALEARGAPLPHGVTGRHAPRAPEGPGGRP